MSKKVVKTTKEVVDAKVFTYVGGGEDSPHSIHFMGKQRFTRGKPVQVTDAEVITKLQNHPTIVEGEISLDELEEYDTSAKLEADKKRLRDNAKDAQTKKAYARLASKDEE